MASPDDDVDRRLTDLEIKASYADDLLDELNRVVARLHAQIDRLQGQVAELRRQAPVDGLTTGNLRDELPPHY